MARFESIKADLDRLLAREARIPGKIGILCTHLGFHAVLAYRVSRWLHRHRLDVLAIPIAYLSAIITGAQISRHAQIGKGLEICHPQGVVVGATAVIGDHCTLVHSNVIGQIRGDGDRPCIGNNFYAGAGAKILGRITIGNNVNVGANSVVIRSLPDGVSVVGVPAAIVFGRQAASATPDQTSRSYDHVLHRLVSLLEADGSLVETGRVIDESTALLGRGSTFDSVDVLRIICAVEEEFLLPIDHQDLASPHLATIGALAAFILKSAVA